MTKFKPAFTLIEVMISVVIISSVIFSLLTMSGNNTHIFSSFRSQSQIDQYGSFLIANTKYGLEDDKTTLDKLVDEFDVESDLRRKLRDTKVEVIYQELGTIDMSEYDEDTASQETAQDSQQQVNSSLIVQIGKSVLKLPSSNSSISLLRIKIQ